MLTLKFEMLPVKEKILNKYIFKYDFIQYFSKAFGPSTTIFFNMLFFKALADGFFKSKCPSSPVSVCVSVHF